MTLTIKDVLQAVYLVGRRTGRGNYEKITSYMEYLKTQGDKVSEVTTVEKEEQKEQQALADAVNKASSGASISQTMLKKINRMSKNELVSKVIAISNYAENMKAANMLLMYKLSKLEQALKQSTPQEAAAETTKEVSNEST